MRRVQLAALADVRPSAGSGWQCPQRRARCHRLLCRSLHAEAKDDSADDNEREARTIAFLKRFTVFNIDQCEGLPDALTQAPEVRPEFEILPRSRPLLRRAARTFGSAATAPFTIRRPTMSRCHGCGLPRADQLVPHRAARTWPLDGTPEPIGSRPDGAFGSASYAREELVAEMASAFACASLSIKPTVRHADYIGSWLQVLRHDDKAIFRAASAASKAADYLLGFAADEGRRHDAGPAIPRRGCAPGTHCRRVTVRSSLACVSMGWITTKRRAAMYAQHVTSNRLSCACSSPSWKRRRTLRMRRAQASHEYKGCTHP